MCTKAGCPIATGLQTELVAWLVVLLQVFYKTHIFGFLGYLVFGMIHFWWNWVVLVPGEAAQDLFPRSISIALDSCVGQQGSSIDAL